MRGQTGHFAPAGERFLLRPNRHQKGMVNQMAHYFFTSESVTEGHPDKICDQISDAILDEILTQDPYARVACETTCTTGMVQIMGEISTTCYVDIPKTVRDTVREIGYDRAKYGFDCDTCAVLTAIDEQSPDIALGVDNSLERKEGASDADLAIGAGDQGMMFGYACDETPELMPLPISLAHALAKRLTAVRKYGSLDYLRPDGKSQVTVEYDEDHRPVRVDTVVLSTQHSPDVSLSQIRRDMIEQVIRPVIPAHLLDENTKYFINPTGRFVVGGPQGDSGLTGRKIIVDTYGGVGRHGGGAFSGKDRPRWTARAHTPRAGWRRTSSPRGWRSAARSSWPTPSAWPSRCPCWSRPSARARWTRAGSRRRCAACSTCAPRPSSRRSICAAPSTKSSPPTATWAARTSACAGSRPTRRRN